MKKKSPKPVKKKQDSLETLTAMAAIEIGQLLVKIVNEHGIAVGLNAVVVVLVKNALIQKNPDAALDELFKKITNCFNRGKKLGMHDKKRT